MSMSMAAAVVVVINNDSNNSIVEECVCIWKSKQKLSIAVNKRVTWYVGGRTLQRHTPHIKAIDAAALVRRDS